MAITQGAHHIGLTVPDLVEFTAEPMDGGPSQHLMIYIPGGIRLELVAS